MRDRHSRDVGTPVRDAFGYGKHLGTIHPDAPTGSVPDPYPQSDARLNRDAR
ncbi:hypothetical protein Psi02_09210 [Planotetraspora silvatica]|uniref:Uncharacterized protein n=1 Tax=Planotetraspora silvatica TaxID=234614 RepID=A0A8J3XJR1_9ACTN|nr:hypothetical protein [Planotetraspora silvatica]GII44497.1 hypothetical protein Psi02_09210 [Planotetraspora silvatica]